MLALLSGMLLVAPVGVTFGGPVPVREDTTVLVGNHLRRAGRCLRTFRTLHYGGSLLGLLGETVVAIEGLNPLGIGLLGLGMAPYYYVGSAGRELIGASSLLPSQQGLLMRGVGRDLRTYTGLTYLGTAQTYGGGIIAILGDNYFVGGLGILTMMVGMYNLYRAPLYIGHAGETLEKLSSFFPASQGRLIRYAGWELKAYKDRFYLGLGLICAGLAISLIGAKDEGLVMLGGLTMLGGSIIVFAAPYSIGTAGERLERAGIYVGVHRRRTR